MPDLAGHDHRPSAFLVYLFLWHAASARKKGVACSYQEIAMRTGLAKRTVQLAVAHLVRRRLLAVAQATLTATPVYTVLMPWKRA
jgi:predicted DNA-binding transcriptional regulator